jgi:hypothetical protein
MVIRCCDLQGDARKVGHMAVAIRCRLLSQLRRADIGTYREFKANCDIAASTVVSIATGHVARQAPDEARVTPRLTPAPDKAPPATFRTELHRLMSSLRGAARRLSEPDEAFFNEKEHTGACPDM